MIVLDPIGHHDEPFLTHSMTHKTVVIDSQDIHLVTEVALLLIESRTEDEKYGWIFLVGFCHQLLYS